VPKLCSAVLRGRYVGFDELKETKKTKKNFSTVTIRIITYVTVANR